MKLSGCVEERGHFPLPCLSLIPYVSPQSTIQTPQHNPILPLKMQKEVQKENALSQGHQVTRSPSHNSEAPLPSPRPPEGLSSGFSH